jgi:hypothetical protein
LLADGAGGIFVIWQNGDFGVPGDIYAQHLNGDGTRVAGWPESGLGVCADLGNQGNPHFAGDGAGGFIAIWGDLRSGGAVKIYGMRVTGSGEFAPGWPVNGREIVGGGGGYFVRHVVSDGSGGAYIGWDHNHGPFTDDDDVYAVRVLGDGSITPGWPPGGYPVSTRSSAQYLTSMAPDGAGGVLLGWYDSLEQPSVAFVQRLGPGGSPALGWPASGLRASDVVGWQVFPRLAPDPMSGAFAATQIQTDGNHGWIQHLTSGGTLAPGWPAPGVPLVSPATSGAFQQDDLAVTADGAGGVIVAWDDFRDGRQSQIYAQRYFGDGPTPVLVSLVNVEALPDRVALTWHDPGRTLSEAGVYRRREGDEWRAIGRAAFGTGRARFEDRDVAAAARYAYRLGWPESGREQFSAETWVEVPLTLALALEGARPNPATGPLTVAFTLPRATPATLELLDVAGRQIVARDVGSRGAGHHVVRLGECGCTPPGMYFLRLTQTGQSLLKRAVIVR